MTHLYGHCSNLCAQAHFLSSIHTCIHRHNTVHIDDLRHQKLAPSARSCFCGPYHQNVIAQPKYVHTHPLTHPLRHERTLHPNTAHPPVADLPPTKTQAYLTTPKLPTLLLLISHPPRHKHTLQPQNYPPSCC